MASSPAHGLPPEDPLRRLGAATRIYAQAGQLGFGVGALPMSIAMVAAGLLAWREPSLAAVALGAAAPPVGVLGAAAARRRYQRLGRVSPAPDVGVTPPTASDVVAAFGRGLLWLWLVASAGVLGAGLFLSEATALLRPTALSFGSALLTLALLRRVGTRRGEVFPFTLAIVGLRVLDPTSWGVVQGARAWAGSMLAIGVLLAAIGVALHLLYLRARRVLAEASAA